MRFDHTATEAILPVGGIGTGNIGVTARGSFCDVEIWNKPGKGNVIPNLFAAVYAKTSGAREGVMRVAEGLEPPPYRMSAGIPGYRSLARFERCDTEMRYPFSVTELHDRAMPVDVTLTAFNPCIPLDSKNSGIPVLILRYAVRNTTDAPVTAGVCFSMGKFSLCDGYMTGSYTDRTAAVSLEYVQDDGLYAMHYVDGGSAVCDKPNSANAMAVSTDAAGVSITHKTWQDGGWWDGLQDWLTDFCDDGMVSDYPYPETDANSSIVAGGNGACGSLCATCDIPAHGEQIFTFYVTWYTPYRDSSWAQCAANRRCDCKTQLVRNAYAAQWSGALAVAQYVSRNFDQLYSTTQKFTEALYGSALPPYVIDAVAQGIAVARSTTCFRLDDGRFYAFEGCHDGAGCCDGNCTHVWNYAQTLAFLFPDCERSMRRSDFIDETDEHGNMRFRAYAALEGKPWDFHPACDGQCGTIVRLYREWKNGADALMRELYPQMKCAMDFALSHWDPDGDGVMEAFRHNTYDIEFYGYDSLTGSMLYAALLAASAMAEAVGDTPSAQHWRDVFARGNAKMDALLYNGEYYVQVGHEQDKRRYQYGNGCLSDQLLGQTLAHLMGLGYILPKEHVASAIHAVYNHNYREDMMGHHNPQRGYALGHEGGLLVCTWPDGSRPRIPFPYSDEAWTGMEYHVATHLIYEGYVTEALNIVRTARERYNGHNRNPWNEIECGNHYARSMSSYGVLMALSGIEYDAPNGVLRFSPRYNQKNYQSFYCAGNSWGIVEYKDGDCKVTPLYTNENL